MDGRILQPPDLLGRWRLRRRLVDRHLRLSGLVVGELLLFPDGAEVGWREEGVLRWNGALTPVLRVLRLRQSDDGWAVHFADGRPFHPWCPGVAVEHPCRNDLYRGLIDATPHRLRTLWDVTGPDKDQRILTRCLRT
jgi:hypothetical protein